MLKLPEKKYEPIYNDELKKYAIGWNSTIENTEYLCNKYGDEQTKVCLLEDKEVALKIGKTPFFKGQYDCIVEIKKINEEEKADHTLGKRIEQTKALLVVDVLMVDDKYICCDEQQSCPLWNKDNWCCEYKRNTGIKVCPLEELPEKKINEEEVMIKGEYYVKEINPTEYMKGYNACIDEILGETK